MKITAVKTFVIDCFRTNWVFVKVMTDEGIEGIGEGTLEYKENALVGAVKDLEHALVGKDPFDTEWIWHENYRDAYWRGGPVLMSALSAVDMALWDIKGKALGVPCWKLLGGKCREAVPCYANCWFSGAKEPEEFAAKATRAVEIGFKGLKWDPFGKNYRQLPPADFKKAMKCVEAVKGATAGKAEILIECHGRFDLPTALRICNALEEFDPYWVEEPIIPDTMRALADLRGRVKVPIAYGERLYSTQQVMDAIESRCCDYLQPDSSHAGGITEMKKIAGICDAHHVPFCAHNPSGPVANAVTLALGVSTPGYCIHETLFDDVPWRKDVVDEDVKFVDGLMYPSNRPGLGITLDEEAAAKHPKQDHWLRHYVGTLTNIRPVDSVPYFHGWRCMKGLLVSAQMTAVAWACMAAVEPYGLLVNRQEVPSDVVSPVFSWMMRADREGACQSAYRIRLLRDGSAVWDSARRAETLSVGQPYDGPPLADATEYEWELSVEDDLGEWSRPVRSRFSTTLLGADAWKEMSFITPADRMPNKCAAASLVRRFVNGKSIRQAVWFTTGLGVYEAHVNGCLVDNRRMKPGFTDVRKCRAVFGCDVTGLIHCGVSETNVLAATVTSGWWSDEIIAFDKPGIHRPYAGKEVAFGGVLVIRYDDGSEERLYTDESWFGTWDGPISHASIFEGEHYDARKSRAWMIDGPDRAFSPVRINREFAGTIRPSVGAAVYQREDLALSPRAAYIWRDAEGGSSTNGIIVNHGRVKVIRRYGGNEECRLSRGETLVIDFGQNCSAVPDLIATAARGTELKIVFGEVLNEGNGAVSRHNDGPEGSVYRANLRGLAATGTQVRYIFSGAGDESYRTFFSVFGYRYASLTSTGDVVLRRIRSIPVSSVACGTEASTIETGVPALNAFVRNVMWSQYSNFLSVPTDCPQRDERLGWGCDARVFVPTACYNAESYAFYRKWLADLCDSQTAEGSFLSAAPIAQFGTETGRFGWSDAALFVANCIWRRYGDLTAIRESWRPMMRYFDYVERTRYTTPEALVYQWADWLSFEKYETYDLEWGRYRYLNFVPKSRRMQLEVRPYWRYLGGCFRLWGARLMAEMAESLGEKRDASRCRTAAANALGDLRRDFLDPADGGLPRFLRGMQTPVLFALRLGLFDRPEAEEAARKSLVDGVIACGNHLTTGYLGTPLVLDVLSHEARAPEVAYTMLLQRTVPSWLYSVEHGATTVWERWNGYTEEAGYARPDMNSFNHYGLGSIVDWLYATMAGIREDVAAPGFKRFVLAPIPDRRIGFCKAKFRSPYGEIVSHWHYSDDGKWHWRFVIPANTTARVTNPLTGTTCECAAGSYDIENLNK